MPLPFFSKKVPDTVQKLWDQIFTFYSILSLKKGSIELSPPQQQIFNRALSDLERFLINFSKSTGIKYKKGNIKKISIKTDNIGSFITSNLKLMEKVIIKRALPFNLEDFIRHLRTMSVFSKSIRSFRFFLAKMNSINWSSVDKGPSIDLENLSDIKLKRILRDANVDFIQQEVIPIITDKNIAIFLNSLSSFPKLAFNEKIIFSVIQLFTSKMVDISNIRDLDKISYWSQVPKNRIKKVLEYIDDRTLKKLAPFLNLTSAELEKVHLSLDPNFIKQASNSRHASIRKFWLSSQQYNVYPILYSYSARGGWNLSDHEKFLVTFYKSSLISSKLSFLPINGEGWDWIKAIKLNKKDSGWLDFKTSTMHLHDLHLDLIGAHFNNKHGIYICIYTTIYGNIGSSRDDFDILSFYVYKQGDKFNWNPDPKKDKAVSFDKSKHLQNKAFNVADKLFLIKLKN